MNEKRNNSMLIAGALVIALAAFIMFLFMASPEPAVQKEAPAQILSVQDGGKRISEQEKTQNSPAAEFSKYKYKFSYDFDIEGHAENFFFQVPVPESESGKQIISKSKITPEPSKFFRTNDGLYAEYRMPSLETGKFNITIEGEADLRTYNIKTAEKIKKNNSPEKDLSRYLKPENGIESDDAYIKKIAAGIKGVSRKEIAANVYKYLQQHMKYQIIYENLGAKKALKYKYGKCTEFAAAMAALLRAKGVPARIVTGYIARSENTPHNWIEVYFDEYGWITYDPSILPEKANIYSPDRKLIRTEKIYEVSHDEIKYIKTAVNTVYPYKSEYSTDSAEYGSISIKRSDEIKKLK